MEGVRVDDPSVGDPEPTQTPRVWDKGKNRMKSLTASNQPSFSYGGMKPGSLVLIAAVLIVSIAVFVGSQSGQAQSDEVNRLHKLAGAWSVVTTVEIAQLSFPTLITFTSDGIVLADEPGDAFETTGHGNWVATGPGEAAFTFLALVGGGPGGNVSATYKVVGKLGFDAHADNWSGPFKIQVLDPDGNELFADRGTFTGTRIAVETLD
jgi:hypothetical protein